MIKKYEQETHFNIWCVLWGHIWTYIPGGRKCERCGYEEKV